MKQIQMESKCVSLKISSALDTAGQLCIVLDSFYFDPILLRFPLPLKIFEVFEVFPVFFYENNRELFWL